MLSHQEYTAWISVGGQPLETYAAEASLATNEASGWIASEAGKEFTVHCRDNSTARIHTAGMYVNIDGQECGGIVIHRTNYTFPNMRDTGAVSMSNVHVSDATVRQFVFSAVRLTDEDDVADTSSAALGQIQVRVWRIEIGNPTLPFKCQFPTDQKVHERSKKAVTHCVGLGKETLASSAMAVSSRRIGQPVAIFTFKYRDQNLLKANGIMPMSAPVPVSAPLKRKASMEVIDLTSTVHEVKQEGKTSGGLVRGERNSDGIKKTENRNKRVKQEQKPGRLMEVIDLT